METVKEKIESLNGKITRNDMEDIKNGNNRIIKFLSIWHKNLSK